MGTTRTASSDGTQIHFEIVGSGDDTLVMLPGLGSPGRGFGPLIDLLAADRTVVLIDPRGSGQSDAPDAPYTGEIVARDVAAVLDEIGVERADLLGLSMGGCISQEFAIRHPDRVRSLVLLATLAQPDDWFNRIIGFRRVATEGLGLPAQLDLALCLVFSPATFRQHPELIERFEQTARPARSNQVAYLRQLDYVLAHDTRDRLAAVRAPALVVVGEDDLLTTPYLTRELAEALPDARHVEIENASHGLCLEHPQQVAGFVREFLAQRP